MKKILIQGIVTVFLFFGTWFISAQIDWIKIFKIQQMTDKTEQKLGELFWEVLKKNEKENKNTCAVTSIDSIVTNICKANKIDRMKIKIHILTKDDVNAFALPNGHLIIYSGLILNSDSQEALTGVICHEIAHIELNHVMKKLVKEIGLSVLISMTTSNGGGEVVKKAAKILSSSAFDRSLEKEADIKAVNYLIKARVNPEPFADFLYKLSDKEYESTKYVTWISTHPNSKERAEYIIEYSKGKITEYKSILSLKTWNSLKEKLKD
ncbi:MAG: M48 family metallopeptidase [Bacteroidetes bacterium]|nr:M48 family metallopeptidase [Bacteroidota bacterium]